MVQIMENIKTLIEKKDLTKLNKVLQEVDLMTIVALLEEFREEDRKEEMGLIFRLLEKEKSIEVFDRLSFPFQEVLIDSLADDKVNEIISEMEPDDRARILDELPARVAKKLLNALDKDERKKTANLLGYAPETAGRIMNPEYTRLRDNETAGEGLEKIKKIAEDREIIYTIYVTDEERKLRGVLSLRELLRADPQEKIGDIMHEDVISVTTDTDQEEVARLLQERDLIAIPVVDREHRLVGIVTFDDAMDIIEEETTEDIFQTAGLIPRRESDRSERLISGPIFHSWKVRLPFLIITMIGGLLAGVVIDSFEASLQAVTALAVFIPVIMDMGGNIGTQSSTIFTRALVLGQIDTKRFLKHLAREIWVGASMGLLLGIIVFAITSFWQGIAQLGLVVSLALFLTLTLATGLGFIVPYVLYKFGMDQAAGSVPFITTIKDISGLLIYFVLANQFLGYLM